MAVGFSRDLEAAKALYFAGDLDKCILSFRALQLQIAQSPDAMPWDEAVEALTYLGEILVKTGDDDGARRAFRAILERDVQTSISPYHHPVEVVFVFNRVKEQVELEQLSETPEETPIPRAPVSTYLPLGIPQLARGRTGAGVVFGSGQLVLGGAALGLFGHLRFVNVPEGEVHPQGWTAEQIENRVQLRRYATQWPATFAFYGLWAGSVLEARGHWRRSHSQPLTLLPGAGGAPGLTIAGPLR